MSFQQKLVLELLGEGLLDLDSVRLSCEQKASEWLDVALLKLGEVKFFVLELLK